MPIPRLTIVARRWFTGAIACLLLSAPPVSLACTCQPLEVQEARQQADVVFAGKVESITVIDPPKSWEPRLLVRFKVARVWKGPVSGTFEMHTNFESSSCGGFSRNLLKEGRTLLVYGFGRPAARWKRNGVDGASNAMSLTTRPNAAPPLRPEILAALPDNRTVFSTSICTRTMAVEYAVEDFKQLGKARELSPLEARPDPALVEATRYISNQLPQCSEFDNARLWSPRPAPANASQLVRQLEDSRFYGRIPKPNPLRYEDLWFESGKGTLGLCRRPVRKDIVCGRADIQFVPEAGKPGRRQIELESAYVQTWCADVEGLQRR